MWDDLFRAIVEVVAAMTVMVGLGIVVMAMLATWPTDDLIYHTDDDRDDDDKRGQA